MQAYPWVRGLDLSPRAAVIRSPATVSSNAQLPAQMRQKLRASLAGWLGWTFAHQRFPRWNLTVLS